jgi:hypothetical protein
LERVDHAVRRLLLALGPLRALLAACVVLVIACAPFATGETQVRDWRFLPSVLGPTLMLLLFFVLPLDMTMSWVFMQDRDDADRRRYRLIIGTEALLFAAMVLAWLPFTLTVLDFWPLD